MKPTRRSKSKPLSFSRVLMISVAAGASVSAASYVLELLLLREGYSYRLMMLGSNVLGGFLAGVLVWMRSRYLQRQLRIVAGLNHNIRNALAAISLSNYLIQPPEFAIIRDGVERISRALEEYVPYHEEAPELRRRAG